MHAMLVCRNIHRIPNRSRCIFLPCGIIQERRGRIAKAIKKEICLGQVSFLLRFFIYKGAFKKY